MIVGPSCPLGALFPHLTVLANICFDIRDQSDALARGQALMDLVELDRAMAGRQPHQRRLMLLDEPSSTLDAGRTVFNP